MVLIMKAPVDSVLPVRSFWLNSIMSMSAPRRLREACLMLRQPGKPKCLRPLKQL